MDDRTALRIWDAAGARGALRAAAVAGALHDVDDGSFLDTPLGALDREFLLALRESGSTRLEIEAECGECGEELDLTVDIDDLRAAASSDADTGGIRQPTTRALLAAEDAPDPAQAIYAWTLAVPEPAEPIDRATAATLLTAADPLLDAEIVSSCPACEAPVLARPDPLAALVALARTRATDLLADVVALARGTGWAERDILAMSGRRRRLYLELVDG